MRIEIHKGYVTEYVVEDKYLESGNFKQLCEELQGYLDTIPLEYKSSAKFDYYEGYGDIRFEICYERPHTKDEQTKISLRDREIEARQIELKRQHYLKLKEEFGDN